MMNKPTRIIWVTEGRMATQKLAEVLKDIQSKECHIVKVRSVQEAICELFESKDRASLIICDNDLHMSLPKRELRHAAELNHVPYLVSALDQVAQEEQLLALEGSEVPEDGPLKKLLKSLHIVRIGRVELDSPAPSCACG